MFRRIALIGCRAGMAYKDRTLWNGTGSGRDSAAPCCAAGTAAPGVRLHVGVELVTEGRSSRLPIRRATSVLGAIRLEPDPQTGEDPVVVDHLDPSPPTGARADTRVHL